jgi:2-amino-4-hydroxy-6-hydroxymethyldihydropteridine diphosphokinase
LRFSAVGISLGSNIGDPRRKLQEVLDIFKNDRLIKMEKISSLFLTEGVNCPPQPPFLNQVVIGKSGLNPHELLSYCVMIEKVLGRKRNVPRGPRLLDIDILFYDGAVISSPELTLPHRAIQKRRSVLVPLAEICPCWIHPVLGSSAAGLLASTDSIGEVHLMIS